MHTISSLSLSLFPHNSCSLFVTEMIFMQVCLVLTSFSSGNGSFPIPDSRLFSLPWLRDHYASAFLSCLRNPHQKDFKGSWFCLERNLGVKCGLQSQHKLHCKFHSLHLSTMSSFYTIRHFICRFILSLFPESCHDPCRCAGSLIPSASPMHVSAEHKPRLLSSCSSAL